MKEAVEGQELIIQDDAASRARARSALAADARVPLVILSPEPRWRRNLERMLLAAALAATAAIAFRTGQHFPVRATAETPAPQVAVVPTVLAADTSAPSPAAGAAPAGAAIADADGLSIDGFSFRQESPGLGRYRYSVVNRGREFRGKLQFQIESGRRDARGRSLPALTVDGGDRLRIRHRLSSGGTLRLDDGIPVRSIEIRLIQDGRIRARRSMVPPASTVRETQTRKGTG
jgi:hypothetical protein